METSFTQLNTDWNAEPNAPYPEVKIEGDKLELIFDLNYLQFCQFSEDQKGRIEFDGVIRYRLGQTNDEGWYDGQCRFSKIAPNWGEFYLIEGDSRMSESPDDWVIVGESDSERNHYLFYLRDETFECVAESWRFEPLKAEQGGSGDAG
ncbi:MAG: hypothetical protein AAGJ81_16030 [Verrucomicrobiota bacterium]